MCPGVTRASSCRSQKALCCYVQVIAQTDTGPGGRSSQLSANSKANAAEMVLQLACWTAATGQGVRGDIAGKHMPSAACHSGRRCVRGSLHVCARHFRTYRRNHSLAGIAGKIDDSCTTDSFGGVGVCKEGVGTLCRAI